MTGWFNCLGVVFFLIFLIPDIGTRQGFLFQSSNGAWEDIHPHLSHWKKRYICLEVVRLLIFLVLKIGIRQTFGFKSSNEDTRLFLHFLNQQVAELCVASQCDPSPTSRSTCEGELQKVMTIYGSDVSVLVVRENYRRCQWELHQFGLHDHWFLKLVYVGPWSISYLLLNIIIYSTFQNLSQDGCRWSTKRCLATYLKLKIN